MPTALITGTSRGFGFALTKRLVERGWDTIVDARRESALRAAMNSLGELERVTVVPGDVADPEHRQQLGRRVRERDGLDLLVNNASVLGPSPLPALESLPLVELERIFQINTFAPLALIQSLLPQLAVTEGTVVNVTSDAAVEPYEGWGGYGSSKAALEQMTRILAVERPDLRVYAFDPGDMRTAMHQEAFPGEDISDRPKPESVVPAFMSLIEERPPSGRYRSADLQTAGAGGLR